MRVGIISVLHESNTFVEEQTTWIDFENDVVARGAEVISRFAGTSHEIGGFLESLAEQDIEAVPILAVRALPYGTIAAETFGNIVTEILDGVTHSSNLDGYLVAVHGATVSESHRDADGTLLEEIRNKAGAGVSIVATIDAHANVSQRMFQSCDALIGYQTNPHVDQHERGMEAARLLGRMLKGEVKPTMALSSPPMAISIESQCTDEFPCSQMLEYAEQLRRTEGILSASIVLGFPYADVPEMGSTAIVITDNDLPRANELAQQLANQMLSMSSHCYRSLPAPDVAVASLNSLKGPVCMLDTGDNVGGGAPGDGTWIAHALLEADVDKALIVISDATAVTAACAVSIGDLIPLSIGGQHQRSGPPLVGTYKVVGIYDGKFNDNFTVHGGFTHFDQGRTAVLEIQGLTIIVTSRRMVPFSLAQVTSCRLDPRSFHVLVAKGVNAPIAAYREVCATFLKVGTAGYTVSDMTTLEYQFRRAPMYPFEQDILAIPDALSD